MQHLDFNLLKVFEALYRERNMTRTAEVLSITPSAVSHAVKRLRESLNDELFIRQGQKMQPTQACRRIAPQLLDNLHQLRKTLQQFTDFDPGSTEQTFNIAIHTSLEPLFMPVFYNRIHQQAPKASIICMALDRNQVQRQMAAGQVDIAIDVAQPLGSPIQHMSLSKDPFCVLISSKHPKAGKLTKADYLEAKHIAVSNRPKGTVMEDFELQQQGYVRQIPMRCQTYQTAAQVVATSELLLTLPKSIAKQYADDTLRTLDLPFNISDIETHLYWHENTEGDASLEWLRQVVLKDAIAE